MTTFSSPRVVILWLACLCLLAGCSKPQPSANPGGGSQGQNKSPVGGPGDEAARIIAETVTRRATQLRTPADVVAGATPTPTLGEQVGAAGKPFTSFGGGFVVTPPPGFSAFSEGVENTTTPDGRLVEKHIFNSDSPSGSAITIGYADFVPEGTKMNPPQEILEAMRDGALKSGNLTLEKEESLTIQGYPALSLYASTSEHIYLHYLAMLKGRRGYTIAYGAYDRAELDRPEVQAFFKSFTFLD